MKIAVYIICVFGLFLSVCSCNKDILNEKPLDFLSPENSYTNPADIQSALTHLYNEIRVLNNGKYQNFSYLQYGTDLAIYSRSSTAFLGDYGTTMLPTSGFVAYFWSNYYKMIFDANVILGRIDAITYPDQGEKDIAIGEAKFFRGYAYRCLVYLYGGVPIVTQEITSPRRDFVRATKEETLAFAINDFKEAAAVLPGVTEVVPGKASNAAALHFLAELYLAKGDPDSAIIAATKVIDDPNIALMTHRFGSHQNDPGDPYWDLFQKNNQNRSSGNTEGIFVIQVDNSTPGGGAEDDYNYNNADALSFERNYGPIYWQLQTPDHMNLQFGPTTQEGGRPVAFVTPTYYLTNTIWGNGNWDVDVRNNERSIKRDWPVTNPASAWYGKKISDFPQSWFAALTNTDTMMYYTPYFTKVTTVNDHPDAILLNKATGEVNSSAGITYHDWYLIREAETYLIRAEAYLDKGNIQSATDDINMVRNRVGAIPVAPADVNIDYILDERMRELSWEEPRRFTLSRLGLLEKRTKMANIYSGNTIQPKNELFPIPYSEIERNTLKVLEQNPGY